MKIHSDTLTRAVLFAALPKPLLDLECTQHGSRSRAHAFNVGLQWYGGKVKGDGRYRRNHGTSGGFDMPWAATYDEWGEWLARLFDIDPNAIAGQYKGRDDFYDQTREVLETGWRDAKFPWLREAA
jgi:hypothetical protein